ncbi:MAG: hydrogen gas-evolving membrane-bound hydrogenase subunit E [Spirochaetota bacterium]
MTEIFINSLLWVIAASGLLSVLFDDLYVSVISLSVFSFLSSLLFYVSHAPDVAITEAAVGAGMTTLIFIWAVQASTSKGPGRTLISFSPKLLIDAALVAGIGLVLYLVLPPISGGPHFLRDFITENGYSDTGASNLVSAVYLGYRAFDTFGETIVLLCAVTGSIFFLSRTH